MKSIRITAALLILTLVSATSSAYIGECPTGMNEMNHGGGSCCDSANHCSMPVSGKSPDTANANSMFANDSHTNNTSDGGAGSGMCQLTLAEQWRDASAVNSPFGVLEMQRAPEKSIVNIGFTVNRISKHPPYFYFVQSIRSVILLI